MGSRASWAASGRQKPPAVRSSRAPRPAGSWSAAILRARESWDALTGGPTVTQLGGKMAYTAEAAAAILATALGLWPDTAAAMGGDDDPAGD